MNSCLIGHRAGTGRSLLVLVPLCLGGLLFSATSADDAAPATESTADAAVPGAAADSYGPPLTGPKKPPGNLWEMIVAGGPMNLAFNVEKFGVTIGMSQ